MKKRNRKRKLTRSQKGISLIALTTTILVLAIVTSIVVYNSKNNIMIKQYKKLLELDDVELEFDEEALNLIVDKAIERKTGARGLRSILEEIMRDVMFDVPSNPKIEKCIITKDTVVEGKEPKLVMNENKQAQKKQVRKKKITAAPKNETAS